MDRRVSAETDLNDFLGVEPPGRWAKYRKPILIGVGALLALALVGWLLARGDAKPRYATERIRQGDLEVKITATGNLAPTNEVTVGSELSGLITVVHVDVNDRVTQGQPIAQIDTERLRDAIARSRAALLQAQAGVGQADATERQAAANLARLEEVHRLSGGKVPSAAELDSARAEHARAAANVQAAKAQVASAQAQLSSDNINLRKATIRSPVTGVVLSRQVEPGQTVAASFNTPTLFTIAEDLSSMELEVKVDEADVGQVREGQTAVFTVDAFPGQQFAATVRRVDVGAAAESGTSAASSSTVVAYTAVLAVDNADLALRPGMTATAEIVTQTERNALLVPNAALRYRPSVAREAGPAGFGMMPRPMRQRPAKSARVSRGTLQTIYILGADGTPQPLQVTAGASNGSVTSISGPGVKAGLVVITSELAAPA